MYQIDKIVKQIWQELKENNTAVNASLDEFADKIEEKTGSRPTKTTTRNILARNGIHAKDGKRRVWVWLHKINEQ